MAADLTTLITARSRTAERVLAFLGASASRLGESPLLLRLGRRLDELRIPLQVLPYEPGRDSEAARRSEQLVAREEPDRGNRQDIATAEDDEPDEATRKRYAFRGRLEQREQDEKPKALAEVESTQEFLVVLGDPGSGKTEWLRWRARELVRAALGQLERCEMAVDVVPLALNLYLPHFAAALRDDAKLRAALVEAGSPTTTGAALQLVERAAAALIVAMIENERYGFPRELSGWLLRRLYAAAASPKLLLCLDALDEVRGGKEAVEEAIRALAETRRVRIAVTLRTVDYRDTLHPPGSGAGSVWRVCPFTWAETEQFVAAFFGQGNATGARMIAELRRNVAVAGMAQNPLMVTLLCQAYAPEGGEGPLGFPLLRHETYERVVRGLLGKWAKPVAMLSPAAAEAQKRIDRLKRLISNSDDPRVQEDLAELERIVTADQKVEADERLIDAKLALHRAIAGRFFPQEAVSETNLTAFLFGNEGTQQPAGYLTPRGPAGPLEQWLAWFPSVLDALCADGLLLRSERTYFFLHLTFHEYLAATALAERAWDEVADDVDRYYANLPEYQEFVVFLAGALATSKHANNAAKLIALLADAERDDVYRQRLALAARALMEVPLERRQAGTVLGDWAERVTEQIFSTWWQIHKRGEPLVTHLRTALPALGIVNGQVSFLGCLQPRISLRNPRPMGLLDALAALLADENQDIKAAAVEAVEGIGAAAGTPRILDQLAALLADEDDYVRWAAVRAVEGIGAAAGTARFLDQLAALLAAGYYRAAWAVGGIGAAAGTARFLDQLAALLAHENGGVRAAAARAVEGIGAAAGTAPILDQLAALLADENDAVKALAAAAVGGIGAAAGTARVLDQLTALLVDESPQVRAEAIWAVEGIGAAAGTERILDQLTALLAAGNYETARAVGKIGAAAGTARFLDQLAALLAAGDYEAADAVRIIGAAAGTARFLDQLAALLADENYAVKIAAADAVGVIGAAAGTARIVDRLAALLADEDYCVKAAAARAVEGIGAAAGTARIVDRLAALLAGEGDYVKAAAARAVGGIGAAAGTARILDQLAALLAHESGDVRSAAAYAVSGIGSAAGTARTVDQLAELLAHGNDAVKEAAAVAVGRIGAAAGTARILDQLAELLANEHDAVKAAAGEAVGGIGAAGGTARILDQLPALLAHESGGVKWWAAHAVSGIGAAAGTARIVDQLAALLADEDDDVKAAAARAVGGIGGIRVRRSGRRTNVSKLDDLRAEFDVKWRQQRSRD